ncbi:MAG: hypothetical protein QM638_04670 [Nocardioides sp.]|uniref:hypothetical protein n=1 Tax=Nocardioides sp. TaxID=35761 RepID=UPI0039E6B438
MAGNIAKRPDGKWRARYRDESGKEHARHFDRKVDAQFWLDEQTSRLLTGTHVAPKHAKLTAGRWCDTWLDGYRRNRDSTVRQAETHIKRIKAAFGTMPLGSVRPSHVWTWTAQLAAEGLEDSYVYALHSRLAQVFSDAVHDGLVAKSPCSRVGRRRRRASSGPTSAPPSRCGRCTTLCPSGCVQRRCSGRSRGCVMPRCVG